MPPKRKRTEDSAVGAAPSTRATRSSARISNAVPSTASTSEVTSTKKAVDEDGTDTLAPPVKKTKTTKATNKPTTASVTKATKQSAAKSSATSSSRAAEKSSAGKSFKSDDDAIIAKKPSPEATTPTTINEPPPIPAPPPVKVQAPPPLPPTANEPYTAARSKALFRSYADNDDPRIIGPEGFQRLCADAEIPLEGSLPLIFAWQFGTKEMMKITEEEWWKGTELFKISNLHALSLAVRDLENILIFDKTIPERKVKKEAYDKTEFWKYNTDKKASFHKLYAFCFTLVKPEQSKNIDMETATALWSVLLAPQYPLMGEVIEFVNERLTTYKAANKDLWSMMLEFCETVNPNLSDYESDGAWPTLLDNFVQWKKGVNV